MENRICPRCNKLAYKNRITKGVCFNCYRKHFWKRKLIQCKQCGRMMPNQAKGYCAGCYHTLFQLDNIKAGNCKRLYGIEYETYKKVTEKCVICGFDSVVDLHHLDKNRQNRSPDNLIGLCPNHHQMLHSTQYKEEVLQLLEQKGYKINRKIGVRNNILAQTPTNPANKEVLSFTNKIQGMNYPSRAG